MAPKSSLHTRSRLGCQTCKIRRVRCDEARPMCLRCSKTGRKCSYADPPFIAFRNASAVANTPPSRAIGQYTFLEDQVEGRAFSYFLDKAAPVLAGSLDAQVWEVLLPRLAHNLPVIKHAILAISHFWEHPVGFINTNGIPFHNPVGHVHAQGLQSYAKALAANRAAKHQSITDILVICTLFSSIELQQSNYDSGFRIMRVVFMLLAPLITNDLHRQNGGSPEVLSIILPMAMRSSGLLFSSSNYISIDLVNDQNGGDVQIQVFAMICRTYAALKDTHVAGDSVQTTDKLKCTLKQQQDRLNRVGQMVLKELNVDVKVYNAWLEYCNICRYWLDMIAVYLNEDGVSQSFLNVILYHVKRLKTNATQMYPCASSATPYFHELIIEPPAYLVAVFGDASIRKEAFALLHKRPKARSRPQLHAIILPTEVPVSQMKQPPFENMMKFVPAEPGERAGHHEGFVVKVEVSASGW